MLARFGVHPSGSGVEEMRGERAVPLGQERCGGASRGPHLRHSIEASVLSFDLLGRSLLVTWGAGFYNPPITALVAVSNRQAEGLCSPPRECLNIHSTLRISQEH
jgi:hypothetical protein